MVLCEQKEKEKATALKQANEGEDGAEKRLSKMSQTEGQTRGRLSTPSRMEKEQDKRIQKEKERQEKQRSRQIKSLRSKQDTDLESQLPKGTEISPEIEVESQQGASVASSLTMESESSQGVLQPPNTSSAQQVSALLNDQSCDASLTSIKTMNTAFFEKLFANAKNMTVEEKQLAAKKHVEHAITRYALAAQRSYELLLNEETKKQQEQQLHESNNNTFPGKVQTAYRILKSENTRRPCTRPYGAPGQASKY